MIESLKLPLILLALLLVVATSIKASAQDSAVVGRLNKDLQRELVEMGRQDQLYRAQIPMLAEKANREQTQKALNEFLEVANKQTGVDKENIKRLEEIVEEYGWPTISLVGEEAATAAFLIVQHAEVDEQKKILPLLKEAAANNQAFPAQVAMLEDRILISEGKKQLYGTQLQTNSATGQMELIPTEDEENVDVRRASVGLMPLAEYLRMHGLEYKPPEKK